MKRDIRKSATTADGPGKIDPLGRSDATLAPELATSRYGKWRALSLATVYLLMMLHFVHWKVAGKTMAPLELSEIMKALELRVLSAGVIFIGLMIVGSAVFGRFFCSWGCHMLAVQDLAHWILKKLRLRPRPIRSRVLLLVPFLAACYMFLWPQLKRMYLGLKLPEASTRLVTTNFWGDLPGPLIITLTFLVCGFLIVYFFGGRGFCTYGCPYGVLFGLFDRLAPGKIRSAPGCIQCGRCTAVCTSNVRVHEQVKAYGMVVDPRCMKDLDCVGVCPQRALKYAFGRPSIARSRRHRPPRLKYDFSIPEELAMVAIFAVALFTWRGLYDRLPFLMSLALSALTAYMTITFASLFYRRQLRLNRYRLKMNGRLLKPGYAFAVVCGIFLIFTAHSTYIQYHIWRGDALLAAAARVPGLTIQARQRRRMLLTEAITHLECSHRHGLVSSTSLDMKLGGAFLELNRADQALTYLEPIVASQPNYPEARIQLANALAAGSHIPEAEKQLAYALRIYSPHEDDQPRLKALYAQAHVRFGELLLRQQKVESAQTHFREALALGSVNSQAQFGLGVVAAQQGRLDDAVAHYRAAIRLDPEAAKAHANLGDVLLARNDPEAALDEYRSALAIDPDIERVRFKMGVVCFHSSRFEQACQHLAVAVEQAPRDVQTHNYYGMALLQAGRPREARRQFQRAIALNEDFADAHFNLARLCALEGEQEAADRHLRRAVQLDPRYARLLPSGPSTRH